MRRTRITPHLIALVLIGAVGFGLAFAQEDPLQFEPPPGAEGAAQAGANDNYEALTRGPLHEAFANPYASDPEAGLIVPKQPPEPINEIPPETAPTGENVQWIPGYWGWEPEEQDFVWVSGLWRDLPPDRRWVPGYWNRVENGYQWTSGLWTSAEEQELSYLPTPPESLESGPNIASPDGDYFWTPGCWIWVENDYQWRPGYWAEAYADWVWVPDYYTWTPYGCVFVSGYWDRDFVHRGTLFSPVRFARLDRGYRYVPRVTISPAALLVHLFVSRPYHHYHFGDYYAFNDSRFGLVTWLNYGRRANHYDPLLTYYQWSYARRGVDLGQRLTSWNQYYVQHEEFRPPRTFTAQRQFRSRFAGQQNSAVTQSVFSQPLQEVVASDTGRTRFRQVSQESRQQMAQSLERFQSISRQRAELEGDRTARGPQRTEPGERARRSRSLELPQDVTALKPTPAQRPETTDPRDPRRGAEPPQRAGNPPPPARPPQDANRPRSPGQRPGQPGQGAPPAEKGEPGRRIPPFSARPPEREQPRGEQPRRPGQQAEPPKRGGPPQGGPPQRGGPPQKGSPPPQAEPPKRGGPPQGGPPQKGGPPPQAEPPKKGGPPQGGPPQKGGPPPQAEPPKKGGPPQGGPPQGGPPQAEPPKKGGPPQGGPPKKGGPPQGGPPQKGGNPGKGKPPGKDKPGKGR